MTDKILTSDLFTFPIVMVDGDKEEKKLKRNEYLAIDNEEDEPEIVIGEAELPYMDFIGVTDRWLPNKQSFNKALNDGRFDACYVVFANVGAFVVPWTKKRFKHEINKFAQEYLVEAEQKVHKIQLSPEKTQELVKLLTGEAGKTGENGQPNQ